MEPFDIKTFVQSLDLTVGMFRLLDTEVTEDANVVVAMAGMDLAPEELFKVGAADLRLPVWVIWMPQQSTLRLHTNLDIGEDSIDEMRSQILIPAVNEINAWAWDRIGKASVQKNEESDTNVGRTAFSIFVPPPLLQSEEGIHALRLLIAANMARLLQEAAVTSIDLHRVLANAGIEPAHTEEGQ